MRIGSVRVAHLPAQVEAQRDATLGGRPIVIGGRPWEKGEVADCSVEAEGHGVSVGMSLRQAEQLCPGAVFLDPDYEAYEEAQRILRHHRPKPLPKGTAEEMHGIVEGYDRELGVRRS